MKASIISSWLLLLATVAHIQNVNGAYKDTPLMKAVSGNDMDLVKRLLANGADAKATNKYGETALMYAAKSQNEKSVELLLPNSDVKVTNQLGKTALMYAVRGGDEKSVELLLPNSDVEATNQWGKTALDLAKSLGHNQIVSLLQQQA